VIETNRLDLRELEPGDLDDVMRLLGDPQAMRYQPGVQTREEGAAWIVGQQERYTRDHCGYWACELREIRRFIGYAGILKETVNGHPELRISYLFLPAYEHGGYAGEALRGCLAYGFEKFKCQQMVALIRSENDLSIRVAQRLGMTLGKTTIHKGSEHGIWGMQRRV
jgi:RimJ/RimL family protein N-acetyltransferase